MLFALLIINDVSLRMVCGISELLSIVWFMSAVAMSIADVRIAAPKKIVAFISLFLSFFMCSSLFFVLVIFQCYEEDDDDE